MALYLKQKVPTRGLRGIWASGLVYQDEAFSSYPCFSAIFGSFPHTLRGIFGIVLDTLDVY